MGRAHRESDPLLCSTAALRLNASQFPTEGLSTPHPALAARNGVHGAFAVEQLVGEPAWVSTSRSSQPRRAELPRYLAECMLSPAGMSTGLLRVHEGTT